MKNTSQNSFLRLLCILGTWMSVFIIRYRVLSYVIDHILREPLLMSCMPQNELCSLLPVTINASKIICVRLRLQGVPKVIFPHKLYKLKKSFRLQVKIIWEDFQNGAHLVFFCAKFAPDLPLDNCLLGSQKARWIKFDDGNPDSQLSFASHTDLQIRMRMRTDWHIIKLYTEL